MCPHHLQKSFKIQRGRHCPPPCLNYGVEKLKLNGAANGLPASSLTLVDTVTV
jgi:hypothetical protein